MNDDKKRCSPPPTVTNYVAVPPDGGWGWVVVAASFFCSLVVDGIVFSFGVLLTPIAEEYGISTSKAAIAGSLLSGFYLISGPFVSAITNRYGFRLTAVLGSIIACAAFALSSIAPTIEALWLLFGLMGGIGFGMIYVPSVVTTGFYFEKLRALATGISVTGSGIGTVIVGPITALLIDNYGWRGALLIQAGVIFNCAVFGSLYRPLKRIEMPVEISDDDDEKDDNENEEIEHKTTIPLLQRIKMARDQLRKADSTISLEKEVGITALQPALKNRFLRANNNIFYPRAIEALRTTNLAKSFDSLELKEKPSHENKRRYGRNIRIPIISDTHDNHLTLPAYPYKPKRSHDDDYDPLKEYQTDEALLTEHIHDDVFYVPRKQKGIPDRRDSITIKYRRRTDSEGSSRGMRPRRGTWSKAESGVRPFYRDDIFFQASLSRLPQYKSRASGLDYTLSVTRLPTSNDVEEEEDGTCNICPEAVRRTLATMLDFSLLLSPSFMLFAVAGFITMMGLFTPFIYLADRGRVNNMDPSVLLLLVSSIGITNTIGRIICGALTMVPQISALMLNNIALTIGGIVTILSGLSYTPTYQFGYAAVFGLSVSFWASLRSIVAVDLIGLEKLTNAFGILLLFQGLAAAIGTPIAGMFMDYTGSYDASFYLSGGLILLSGVICYPLNSIKKWEESRKEKEVSEV